jgi:hypothetical protein
MHAKANGKAAGNAVGKVKTMDAAVTPASHRTAPSTCQTTQRRPGLVQQPPQLRLRAQRVWHDGRYRRSHPCDRRCRRKWAHRHSEWVRARVVAEDQHDVEAKTLTCHGIQLRTRLRVERRRDFCPVANTGLRYFEEDLALRAATLAQ